MLTGLIKATLLYGIPAIVIFIPATHQPCAFWLQRFLHRLQIRLSNRLSDIRRPYVISSNNQKNPATKLPPEILLRIFAFLRDSSRFNELAMVVVQPDGMESAMYSPANQNTVPRYSEDLCACARACRAWRSCANELLFEHVVLRTHGQLLRLADTSTPRLARVRALDLPSHHRYVQPRIQRIQMNLEYRLGLREGDLGGWRTREEKRSSWIWRLADPLGLRQLIDPIAETTLRHAFEGCVNLQTLGLWAYSETELREVVLALNASAPATLQHLRIRFPRTLPSFQTGILTPLDDSGSWTHNLRSLSLTGFHNGTQGSYVPTLVAFPALKTLHIRKSLLFFEWFHALLKTAPNLTALVLIDVYLHVTTFEDSLFRNFLAPVAKQLQELTAVNFGFNRWTVPQTLEGLPMVRALTVDMPLSVHPLHQPRTNPICASASATLQKLVLVFRPRFRGPDCKMHFLTELLSIVHTHVRAASEAADELEELEIWDYVTNDSLDIWITAVVLFRREFARVLPTLQLSFNFVRLPYVLIHYGFPC